MKATEDQIQQWKEKHGTIYELESEGKIAYVFDPLNKLVIMKALMQAMLKGSFEYVDAFLTHCWIDGDPSIKTDDKVKAGFVDQVQDLIDIPEFEIQYDKDNAIIIVEDHQVRVRMASRQDIKFAEDKNKSNKPLDTQIFLLERIALSDLTEIRAENRLYVALLLAVNAVKDKKYVSVKKL